MIRINPQEGWPHHVLAMIRDWDEALHADPHEMLTGRLGQLEGRIRQLEASRAERKESVERRSADWEDIQCL